MSAIVSVRGLTKRYNGTLAGGLHGGKAIHIERTKYWDYRSPKVWQAVREL